MAKILDWEPAFDLKKFTYGTNFVKGDYIQGTKLYPVVTSEGTFNLDRAEVLELLAKIGLTTLKNVTVAALQKLVGTDIDVSRIQDK